MKASRIGLIGIAGIVLVPMILGTSPRPAPYSEYFVRGSVVREGGGARQNFVVSLVGKFSQVFW